jgi:hypothetical protein
MGNREDDKMAVGDNNRAVWLRLGEQPADMGRREGLLMGSDREGIDGRLGSGGQDEHDECPDQSDCHFTCRVRPVPSLRLKPAA